MKLGHSAALIVVAALCVGLLLAKSSDRSAPDASPTPPAREQEHRSAQARAPLASVLRVRLLPPSGHRLADAQVTFFGPEEGQVVTDTCAPGQSSVELDIAAFLRVRKNNKYVGHMLVEAPALAKYMRWITVDDALRGTVVEIDADLSVGHDLRVLVVDQSGAAASGAVILAAGQQQIEQPGFLADWRVEADRDGRCVLRGLSPGDWTLHAGQWKDWSASEHASIRFGVGEPPPVELVLAVTRWSPTEYSSGSLETPKSWRSIHLEDCGGGAGSFSIYGDEFYARIPQAREHLLRAVDGRSGKRSTCVRVVGGQHGLRLAFTEE